MRHLLIALAILATLKAHSTSAQTIVPLSEGVYSWAALVAPSISLTGEWAISPDGYLTTSEVGAVATIAIDGAWAVINGTIDATICAPLCAPYAGPQAAYGHTGEITITNASVTTLDTLWVLQGVVAEVTPEPMALIVPPPPSVTYSAHDGQLYAHDRTISLGDTLIITLLGAGLALQMVRYALEVLWTRR